MTELVQHIPLAVTWPIKLEYLSGGMAALLFLLLGAPIVLLGMRSLNGLGPVRKWVAIGVRLAVLLTFILIIGGVRWQRRHKDVEVMIVRDISPSTLNVTQFPGSKGLQAALNDYFRAISEARDKKPDDRVGVLSFNDTSLIDAMPNRQLMLDAKATREPGNGTDAASAIQLALATLGKDAMHRLVLVWDGNATSGDLDAAINAAVAQKVPIDVVPLSYDIQNEVLLDRFIAPTWVRENEPFTIEVILKSTNATKVQGKLTVTHNGAPMDLDPYTAGVQATKLVTLEPGLHVERIKIPPLPSAGVHQFHASFDAENVTADVNPANEPGAAAGVLAAGGKQAVDTLLQNNSGDSFTFVRGKGKVLYIDNVPDGRGKLLADALAQEGITVEHTDVHGLPTDLVQMQNYDAIILANTPRGHEGISEDQQRMLASYVHDMGGGLVMIGGEEAFGAGGWQGSKLEDVLPVNMDIPAQRQIPKGALVLVMHACEMPDGNYWGLQCAMKAIETLSERDEIGIISYGWGAGGSQWDFPLQEKGDGTRVMSAAKSMKLGDMPSFDECMELALNGKNGGASLKKSDAKQKHVIIISDGDPAPPAGALVDQYKAQKITVSTVTVYPHMGDPDGLPPDMKKIAKDLGGRAYGPINNNPNQLPQIFIKEASVVRRSLIFEPKPPDPPNMKLNLSASMSEMVKGMGEFPDIFGMVLTSRKNNPQIEIPLTTGKNRDPVLAHWQTGLGKAAVWTSDANNKWGAAWVASPEYSKFWAQVVRAVSRPPMSTDFDVTTRLDGDKGKIVVEALNKEGVRLNFLNIRGQVVGPRQLAEGAKVAPQELKLVQTGPGRYEAEFDTKEPGNYVTVLNYTGPQNTRGILLSGVAMNSSPELRELHSNDAVLRQIADRTRGRVLKPFDTAGAEIFNREGLAVTASPLPVWDIMIPVLLGLILADVATRRIAWDWEATKRWAGIAAEHVRGFTQATTLRRSGEGAASMDALKRVRSEVAEQKFKGAEGAAVGAPPLPDRSAKFESRGGVEGDITKVVGGATDKPVPPPPKKIEPKGGTSAGSPGGHMGGLLEAKRRAQQKIKEKEQGEGQ